MEATKDELLSLLTEWQTRLRLQDWDIALELKKHTDGELGSVRMIPKYKSAEIELQLPDFIDPDFLGNKDVEVSLVHELLHVQAGHLTSLLSRDENAWGRAEMERLVELTAIALVKLKRERISNGS